MTFEEIKKSTIEDFAEQLVAFDACPRSDGSEDICVIDSEGAPDCKTCWMMHLNGEDRENVIDDAKRPEGGTEYEYRYRKIFMPCKAC